MMIVLCDRWIDEVRGERCEREAGHDGPCAARIDNIDNPLTNGGPGGPNKPAR